MMRKCLIDSKSIIQTEFKCSFLVFQAHSVVFQRTLNAHMYVWTLTKSSIAESISLSRTFCTKCVAHWFDQTVYIICIFINTFY